MTRKSPKKYDPDEVWPILLTAIANGASLTAALRELDPTPSYWWAKSCLKNDSELKERYTEAVEDRADVLAEQIIEIADSEMPDGLDGPSASAWVQQLRIKVEARKWSASKLKARTYGNRVDIGIGPKEIDIRSAMEAAKQRAAIPSPDLPEFDEFQK